jgi:hypothetical protein
MSDEIKELVEFKEVTRIELIRNAKRLYVTHSVKNVKISLQDNNRTLKIFFEN